MKRVIRKAALGCAALATGATVLTTVGVNAPAAKAAGVCESNACAGLDPNGEVDPNSGRRCDATETSKSEVGTYAALVNHYSQGCFANWASAALLTPYADEGYSLYVYISAHDFYGNSESMCYPGPSNTGAVHEYCYDSPHSGTNWAYTDMVDGTYVTAAGVSVYDPSGNLVEHLEVDF